MSTDAKPTLILMHGIGLGPWLWDRWAPFFESQGFSCVRLTMPGHGDGSNPGVADLVAAAEGAVEKARGPCILVGHSMSGLVAQLVAARHPEWSDSKLMGIVLVCPLPPGQVRVTPDTRMVKNGLKLAPAFLLGKPLRVSKGSYTELGLNKLPQNDIDEVFPKILPWPNKLAKELLLPPKVDIEAIRCPVLVVAGKEDRLVPWDKARVLGDLYEAVVWRYDNLAHTAPLEPGGERMGEDVARWCAAPERPRVLESEGFAPTEGVGHTLRRQRRGEEMKKRSAYGQKASAHR